MLKGITTDGSALYPEPIRQVFGDVPHQICTFHVIKEMTKGVLKALAKERQRLAKSKPKLKRGRPNPATVSSCKVSCDGRVLAHTRRN